MISHTAHRQIRNSNTKSCSNRYCFYSKNNDQIRSQFCTCYDSLAVMTCAKLWPDWMIRIKIRAKWLSRRFCQLFMKTSQITEINYILNNEGLVSKRHNSSKTAKELRLFWMTYDISASKYFVYSHEIQEMCSIKVHLLEDRWILYILQENSWVNASHFGEKSENHNGINCRPTLAIAFLHWPKPPCRPVFVKAVIFTVFLSIYIVWSIWLTLKQQSQNNNYLHSPNVDDFL